MPLADAFLEEADLQAEELTVPLTTVFCESCSLVQILETVAPEVLFRRSYPYYSSVSDELAEHSRRNAMRLIAERSLGARSLVVELASNDGYLLRYFAESGIPVLGIDPAEGPASAANQAGIPTLCEFFGKDLAHRLRSEGTRANVVIGNNVLAHVADLGGFVSGVETLLADHGVAVFEVPYVRDLVEHCEFDTIYHEHLCYFSVSALAQLFRRHGLTLQHVEHYPIHGGSLRLFVGRGADVDSSVSEYLHAEKASGMDTFGFYKAFGGQVSRLAADLRKLLHGLKRDGARIVGYGAAAKASVLLNYTGLGRDVLDFVVDRSVHKQGRFMPGVHIPIVEPSRLLTEMPRYTLLLAWNFRDEVLRQQDEYTRLGGRFIVPIPNPVIVPGPESSTGIDR